MFFFWVSKKLYLHGITGRARLPSMDNDVGGQIFIKWFHKFFSATTLPSSQLHHFWLPCRFPMIILYVLRFSFNSSQFHSIFFIWYTISFLQFHAVPKFSYWRWCFKHTYEYGHKHRHRKPKIIHTRNIAVWSSLCAFMPVPTCVTVRIAIRRKWMGKYKWNMVLGTYFVYSSKRTCSLIFLLRPRDGELSSFR